VLLVSSNVELPVLPEARMEIRNEMRLPSVPQNTERSNIVRARRQGQRKKEEKTRQAHR